MHPDVYFIHASGDDVLTHKSGAQHEQPDGTDGLWQNDGRFFPLP